MSGKIVHSLRAVLALAAASAASSLPARAAERELQLEARLGTDLVEHGISLTRGGPGFWLHGEYGDPGRGFFVGLDAHNIDFVPNGAPDRNLFLRLSPYVGWRWPVGEHLRLTGSARYVFLPDAIPHTQYPVFNLRADWNDRFGLMIDHSPDRFGLGESTTIYQLDGTLTLGRGLALRGEAGWHDFSAVGGDDYSYAGIGLLASTPRYEVELAYHALDGNGDRMFAAFGGEPGLVLTVTGHSGPARDWSAPAPDWLKRISMSAELRSEYISAGVAQTLGTPAVQIALEYAWPKGTYFEIWGSNVDYTPEGEPVAGADSEIDYTLGHRFTLSKDWKLDARAAWYSYPGAINRSQDWDEIEYLVDATWSGRLRLKASYKPDVAGVHKTQMAYSVRWKQALAGKLGGSLEFGHKDKKDWGASYNWSLLQLSHPLGPVSAMLRYWWTNQSGRKDNGTADPTWEIAFGWGQ